ncbi:hypothetical protein Q0Z83_047130 [Actinoplanes sichuanensis]|uniref:Tetratricopeptide repeat protein n=1 Tax=Actinoplanes sichuanensis TaxID=512349 RepID=A0ABW4AA62_9ACTN|nr:hypothetical protein [Actinoplanes sichuanensis]BEL06522.1 hypothetical protein Q0Z83_047130 [Actinoplanes sichuanensis]
MTDIEDLRAAAGHLRGPAAASPTAARELGSILYALGEHERGAGDFTAATATLDEAETAYRSLGDGGEVTQLVADVVIRRARVHAEAGRPLSAIADTQQAVLGCLELATGALRSPARLAVARVLAHAAHVQLMIGGDPDLIAGAADFALREIIGGLAPGDGLELSPVDAGTLGLAGRVAAIVHTAAGRPHLAEAAQWLAGMVSGGPVAPTPADVAQVRDGLPTLAAVLTETGNDRYLGILTAPPTEVRLLVPAMRVGTGVAAAYGAVLGRLQPATSGPQERLVGLEAHALFAWASQQGDVNMRHQFQTFGLEWLSAVVNYGQRHAEEALWPAALDASAWLTGIVGRLAPFTLFDADVRRNVLAVMQWQEMIFNSTGDTEAAARVAEARATMDSPSAG